ncbi:hypothetical protein PIB30_058380 [Stylosanthes scabra]|uniref:Uncharacterized protein n=1 Tax=Stylosanthes scabra TaxID=79078 RepID=A0ABU6XIK3_9FABA|nr:hypothetical protein [Stylosanthes scabra]
MLRVSNDRLAFLESENAKLQDNVTDFAETNAKWSKLHTTLEHGTDNFLKDIRDVTFQARKRAKKIQEVEAKLPPGEIQKLLSDLAKELNHILEKLSLRHPYRTRSQSKAMDDLGHAQEEIKEEMNQMKEQIAKILEALQAMSTNGIPAILGGERTNVPQYPPNFGSQGITIPLSINSGLNTSMPLYGLPPGYTPPIATYSDNVTTTQNVFQPNMDVSQAFPRTSIEGFATTKVEPQILNIPISSAQTYPAMALSSLSKEKLETLEERLREIEGVNNYGLVEA